MMLEVTAALIFREGRVLAARRPRGDRYGGLWEFPGGKMEPGEGPEECLAREIREELGIEVDVMEHFHTNVHSEPGRAIRLMAYRCIWVSGELKPREHESLAWLLPSELEPGVFAPADRPIVERLKATPTFFNDLGDK